MLYVVITPPSQKYNHVFYARSAEPCGLCSQPLRPCTCLVGTRGRVILRARGDPTNSSSSAARDICAPERCSAAPSRCWQSVEMRAVRLAASVQGLY